jgi:hypothetical protein
VIIDPKKEDVMISNIRRRLEEGDPQVECFHEDEEGTLWFKRSNIGSKGWSDAK